MGKVYHLRCESCDWNEVFYIGVGLNDGEAQANEALLNLLESEHGGEYDAFIRTQEHVGFRIERSLYRCRHCGRLQVRLQAQIRSADTVVSPAYYCDQCGKMLGKVRPHMIKKQLCPVCRKPIIVEKITGWDIAPEAESAVHIKQDDDRFFCPVYDGLINRYDCDEISCGVKNGWIPNDGLPPLVEVKVIRKKADLCKTCPGYQ